MYTFPNYFLMDWMWNGFIFFLCYIPHKMLQNEIIYWYTIKLLLLLRVHMYFYDNLLPIKSHHNRLNFTYFLYFKWILCNFTISPALRQNFPRLLPFERLLSLDRYFSQMPFSSMIYLFIKTLFFQKNSPEIIF